MTKSDTPREHFADDEVIETRPGFDSGDVQCLGCGRTIHLWFNGGELDRETCCGYTYSTEAVVYQLVITGPAPIDHTGDYFDGDGFIYCQECTEATGDFVLVSDCRHRNASVRSPGVTGSPGGDA